jgi:hypothetical protein
MKNLTHMIIGGVFSSLGIVSLLYEWREIYALLLYAAFIFYLGILIACCAIKSRHNKEIFPLPDRTWALLLILLMLSGNISNFGNLYIQSKEVKEQVAKEKPLLEEASDAIYFSTVTITTLGYGDFVPVGSKARRYVVLQLVSGVLLLLFIFPIVASRLSDLDK